MTTPSLGRRGVWAAVGAAAVLAGAVLLMRQDDGARVVVVFDGQSLNRAPERGYPS
jgi:hypothetical protein